MLREEWIRTYPSTSGVPTTFTPSDFCLCLVTAGWRERAAARTSHPALPALLQDLSNPRASSDFIILSISVLGASSWTILGGSTGGLRAEASWEPDLMLRSGSPRRQGDGLHGQHQNRESQVRGCQTPVTADSTESQEEMPDFQQTGA